MPIYWGFKNENLHSVNDIRSLGVCQSSEVSRMKIFILLRINCYLVDLQASQCLVPLSGQNPGFMIPYFLSGQNPGFRRKSNGYLVASGLPFDFGAY